MTDVVVETSNLLEVSEKVVFQQAYHLYFGTHHDYIVNHDYGRYLTDQVIPVYIRHYHHKVVSDCKKEEKSILDKITKLFDF